MGLLSSAPVMDAHEVRRYARHITLSDIGGQGQDRLLKSRVRVSVGPGDGAHLAAESALRYLAAAGVGALFAPELAQERGGSWSGARPELTVPGADGPFDLELCVDCESRLKHVAPLNVAVTLGPELGLKSSREAWPAPTSFESQGGEELARAVLLGTLAATEILWLLIKGSTCFPASGQRALSLPTDIS